MDTNFLAIIQKVISDRGRNCINNLAVFNSLLADYAKGNYHNERRIFIRELRTKSYDELMMQYRPPQAAPASYPQPVAPSASPMPQPQPPVYPNYGDDDDTDNEEFEKLEKHLRKGFKSLDENNNEKAEKHFRKAMSISPNGSAYFGLACCYARSGNYSQAIDLFEDAGDLFEEEGDKMGIKHCNRAISDIKNTVKQREENTDKLINLGINIFSELFLK